MQRLPRIMVIDDSGDICEALTHWLQSIGYDAIACTDGCSALATLSLESARSPLDLVLLDLNMPGMNGMAVLRELRQRHREIPVIMMSGTAMREDFEEAVRLGACDYVQKPMDFVLLRQKFQRVLGRNHPL